MLQASVPAASSDIPASAAAPLAEAAAEAAAPALGEPAVHTVGNALGGIAQAEGMFGWGGYFQALAILFFIVALLWVALWYLKRKGGFKLLTAHGDLAVESRMALGSKKSLMVVRFLNKRLLLGVTDHQITMLTELTTDEHPSADASQSPSDTVDFPSVLNDAVETRD